MEKGLSTVNKPLTETTAEKAALHDTAAPSPTHGQLRYAVAALELIRDARPDEASALEALQRRSSDVWEEYRAQLAANPDAIEPPHQAIADGRVRVAVDP